MPTETNENWFKELFIDEAKAAITARENWGGGGEGEVNPLDALIEGSPVEVTSNATNVKYYTFYQCMSLKKVVLPKATGINGNAFYYCSALETITAPLTTYIGSYCFVDCKVLKEVDMPLVTSIGSEAFSRCRSLKSVIASPTKIQHQCFSGCSSLTAVVIRSETFCTLETTNAFNSCYHYHGTVNSVFNPDGLKDGYIYVPAALVEEYKVATNWATFATQFRALEDYTVDGTITGELDWDKINKVVINFTIDGTSYQADEGMTWTEWCGSSYNTAGYVASSSDQSVIAPSGNSLLDASGYVVDKSAAIINSHAYTTYNPGGGGAN